MFVAKYSSTCAECQQVVAAGSEATFDSTDRVVHMRCPTSDDVSKDAEKNAWLGFTATDAYGNVLAVMTERGWIEPEVV